MNDLIVASMILGVLSLIAFTSGLHLGRRLTPGFQAVVGISAVLLMGVYLTALWNRPLLAYVLPTSGLIILANWLPIWGGFLVGIYAASQSIARFRRGIVTAFTMALVAYSCVAPLLGEAPRCRPAESNGAKLVHQTTPFTCSPAAGASMLRLYGIEATEGELANLCLTRRGTHWLGLYRGLKLKTEDTNWMVTVEPFSRDALDRAGTSPCVLSINLDTAGFDQDVDHGFLDTMGHSVVYLRRNGPESISVFDPSPDYGVEAWNHKILNCVTGGVILGLAPRERDAQKLAEISRSTARLAAATLTVGL